MKKNQEIWQCVRFTIWLAFNLCMNVHVVKITRRDWAMGARLNPPRQDLSTKCSIRIYMTLLGLIMEGHVIYCSMPNGELVYDDLMGASGPECV
jgi:hypothetical protein